MLFQLLLYPIRQLLPYLILHLHHHSRPGLRLPVIFPSSPCRKYCLPNPLVYLMVKAANRDLEYSCDDSVVQNSGLEFRKEYALAILKAMQNGQAPALCTGLAESDEKAKKDLPISWTGRTKRKAFGPWPLSWSWRAL